MRDRSRSLPVADGGKTARLAIAAFFALVPLVVIPAALSSHVLAAICAVALLLAVTAPVFGLARVATSLVLVGMTTVTFNDVHPIASLGWMELCDPFLLFGFTLLLPQVLGRPLRLPPTYLTGAIGLLSVGTLSALFTAQPLQNFSHLLDVVRGLIFVPVFFAWWQPGRRTVAALALAYMLGNVIDVGAALLEGATFDDRYAGLTSHPNTMGICEVLGIAVAPFLLAELRARYHWIVGLMTAVCMVGVWITGSRAAFVCAVLLILLYPVLNRSIPAAIAIGALSLTAFAVADHAAQHADPNSTLGRLLGEGTTGQSNEARREGARLGIEQFMGHPLLGDGWLTVWGAHDGYIQVAAATGIVGLASYLLLVAGLLRPIFGVAPPAGLLGIPMLATVMLDIFLPVLGARYVWVVVGMSLFADGLAADQQPPDPVDPDNRPAALPARGLRP